MPPVHAPGGRAGHRALLTPDEALVVLSQPQTAQAPSGLKTDEWFRPPAGATDHKGLTLHLEGGVRGHVRKDTARHGLCDQVWPPHTIERRGGGEVVLKQEVGSLPGLQFKFLSLIEGIPPLAPGGIFQTGVRRRKYKLGSTKQKSVPGILR